MPSSIDTTQFILSKLRHPERFSARKMFGEFGLYTDGKMVAVICDDRLYVKIASASAVLEDQCEKGEPYPRAKPHYLVDETQLSTIQNLPAIMFALAKSAPSKTTKGKSRKPRPT